MKKRVLIADDYPENLYLLESILEAEGYQVLQAPDGEEAFRLLQEHGVDLIISDILMPRMDGFQLCRRVKGDENLRPVPFIFYTATYTGSKDEEFARKLGAEKFIVKPCEPELLLSEIEDSLNRGPGKRNAGSVDSDDAGGAGAGEIDYESEGIRGANGQGGAAEGEPFVPLEDAEALSLYSQRLVRKLEQKMMQVEQEKEANQQAALKIEQSLREKEILIKELYHRTKNNMQVLSSLLRLKASCLDNPEIHRFTSDMEKQIYAIALVHEKLMESEDLSYINLAEYLAALFRYLLQHPSGGDRAMESRLELEPLNVLIDTAVPIGLVVTELVTNALRHAFVTGNGSGSSGAAPLVELRLRGDAGGGIHLEVNDNGSGIPRQNTPSGDGGFGLSMVKLLVEQQLKGQLRFDGTSGTICTITIPEEMYTPRV